jgi:uncharacterized membrane protein
MSGGTSGEPRQRGMLATAWRIVTARRRLFIGLACGLAAAPLLPAGFTGTTRSILAWDIGVSVFLVLVLVLFLTEDHQRMAADAAAQEEGEWTIFALIVAAVAISMVAIAQEFGAAAQLKGASKLLHVGLVAATLLLTWLMLQATFALRYAHEYYEVSGEGPAVDGGLNFPGEEHPDYMDFLYFSLVLGMTFQVSDVAITSRKLRRLAALHGFLGFVFNTVILALTVNIAAGLL